VLAGFTVVLLLDLGFAQSRMNPVEEYDSLLQFLDELTAETGGRFQYFLPWNAASRVLDANLRPTDFERHPDSRRLQDVQANTVAAVSTKYRHVIEQGSVCIVSMQVRKGVQS
jgi:hypothetical protein